jgi:hypothetical protein
MSFFEIFQPGIRHLYEEKERRRMLVSKPTHGGGAPLGIDLDAGVAKIRIPRAPAADAPPEAADYAAQEAQPAAEKAEPGDRPGS